MALELLESRTLMAVVPTSPLSVLPPPVVPQTGQVDISNSEGNESTPMIAVDKNNPLKLAAVWTRNDQKLGGDPKIFVEGATSTDGGLTWRSLGFLGFQADPTTSNPIKVLPQITDASVAFDRNDNFYVLDSQHQATSAANTPSFLVLNKYDFSGGTPSPVITNKVVYASTQDFAVTPMLAVDDNVASFVDTDSTGQPYTQKDPFSGNVYIAWATNNEPFKNAPTDGSYNPNQIQLIASSDGGNSFSGQITLDDTGDFGRNRYAAPQLVVSQGRPRDTALYGANDQGVPGGQVSVVFDDFGSAAGATPPFDIILSNRIPDGAATESFAGGGGVITDAPTAGAPVPTDFPINVNITDTRFTSLTNLTVDVTVAHSTDADLSIVLMPPVGSGLSPITLVAAGGATGANLGIAADGVTGGTVFDDNTPRSISDGNSVSPYIGHYSPQGGSLNQFYQGATAAQLNGVWTLEITDTKNSNVGSLRNWGLHFSSGLTPTGSSQVTTTFVRGALTPSFPLGAAVSPIGIGPGLSIASDNTLGAFSPHEGRLYLAYVDHLNITGNPSDNTDIFLLVSDDAGATWHTANQQGGFFFGTGQQVNDDLGTADGFSEANQLDRGRPQFEPQVAVDATTGTVVMSWLDARNDAARARVATYLTASNDGGENFSAQVFANTAQTAVDAITGQTVNLGPIPENQSPGNGNTDGTFGFGVHQGLAVYGGSIHPIWSSNLNGGSDAKALLDIRTVTATTVAGPRIIDSTMGPAGLPGDPVNPQAANAATPVVSAFQVTFDRPVDPNSFTAAAVSVFFRDTTPGNVSGGPVPVVSVVPIPTPTDPNNPNNVFGFTQFQVNFAPRTAVGTYSYVINPVVQDRIRTSTVTVTPSGSFQNFVSTDVPKPIPDVTTITSTVVVSGFTASQVLANATVTLNLTHTFDSDLVITLIAPDGTPILLSNREGFNGRNYLNTTFTDAANRPISNGFAPFTGSFRPEQALAQLKGHALNGTWTLRISDVAPADSGNLQSWSLSLLAGTVTSTSDTGNSMDQNADGIAGEPATSGVGLGDVYAAPSPTSTGGAFLFTTGQFFPGPYDQNTLPLIVPGPHVVASHVPNTAVTADNLVLNATVAAIDVTFDRDMDPSSITPASIVRVMGPAGLVAGPFAVVANPLSNDPNPNAPRTYRIGFPVQQLNGTYTVTLASSIKSAAGDALDTSLDAGVALLKGTPTAATTPVKFSSLNVPVPILAQKTITSQIAVPAGFLAQGVTLQLNITYPNDPDLEASLIGPDGTVIKLFTNVGTAGGQQGFSNTIFDDAAATPIQNGGRPFFGSFKPQQALSAFNGLAAGGIWTLQIKDDAANGGGSGTLNSWSLTFQKSTASSGVGEPVADQATVSFRILVNDPTNPLSHNDWTSVGPGPITNNPPGNGYSGQIGGIAVDPSDPSGNTVYVAGASGGVWRTNNFLTNAPGGPTYIPLTDFGPSFGMNIGSLAVFGRNNDPNQSIIFAGTGNGDSLEGFGSNASQGVGFLRSTDGGATWTLLDSTNNNFPFAARDHIFAAQGGTSTFKVVVDPRPTPNGNVIVYAAMSGPNGGLWRSVDTGNTWSKLSTAAQGNATDISLDLNSATIDAVSNPTGNVNVIYAAFAGVGVFISPNRGQTLDLMAGGNFDPLIRDANVLVQGQPPAIGVGNPVTPGAGAGRIVLAKPALVPATDPNADLKNLLYEGWLYAAVATADGSHLQGLYVTKDDGATWTQIKSSSLSNQFLSNAFPTNNPNSPNYDVLGSSTFPDAGREMALTVDPTNPNVIYLGGTSVGQTAGLLRFDITGIYDSHSEVAFDGSRPDGGALQINTPGRVTLKKNTDGPPEIITPTFLTTQFLNLLQDPSQAFLSNTTISLFNVNNVDGVFSSSTVGFVNNGSGVTWIPFDEFMKANPGDFSPSTNVHQIISIVDPLTGHARLILGDDQGIFTGVDTGNGVFNPLNTLNTNSPFFFNSNAIDGQQYLTNGIGTAQSATYSRNGNLQISQFYYGAAQPSSAAAQIAAAILYGNGLHTGIDASAPDALGTGNTSWTAPTEDSGVITGVSGTLNGEFDGTGVQTDQQGRGIVYQYAFPGLGGNFTDFFQVSVNGTPFISRTTGLVQANRDPQWPLFIPTYPAGIVPGNFAVNPIAGDEVIISSNAGRIFSTINQGRSWLVIGDPTALDGTYAPALAFGAPDPTAPAGIGNLNNFLYAGTVGGKIFVTQTGGGTVGQNNQWKDISTGLDGSAVLKIITNPTRGSHEAYAITVSGVYHTADSLATPGGGVGGAGSVWTNITGNLLGLLNAPFGNVAQADTQAKYLTSIVADWRYVIPNNAANPTGPTHPVLYASAESGVYRSLDNGATWSLFPSLAFDGSAKDGGLLPNVHVSDLNLATGNIDPTTGRAVSQPGDPNNLFATTFGRGTFTIRLAPIVFPNTVTQPNNIHLDTTLPAPAGSNGGTATDGTPLVTISQPVIDGFSEQTAFGNNVRITLFDLTNPNSPRIIGGFDPSKPATDVAANRTDAFGKFAIQVNAASFTFNGKKTIGIQATDGSGTKGNIATFVFTLQAKDLGLPQPPNPPTIGLSPFDDSSHGSKITNITQPHIIGATSQNVSVALFRSVNGSPTGAALATGTSDAQGNYNLLFTTPLPNGPITVQVVATNTFGSANSQPLTFTIDTQGPTTAPTLGLLPADDTGIKGDGITSSRRPHFTGTTEPNAIVDLFNVTNLNQVLAETTANASGVYTMQLPNDLNNGTITLEARARDVAGNPGPISGPLTLTIATVPGDYNGDGKADLSLYVRTSPLALWQIQGVTPAAGTPFGNGTHDIPIEGDFNGTGKDQLGTYNPITATWSVQGVYNAIQYGQGLVDLPAPGDYFGIGHEILATFRPTTGEWFFGGSAAPPPHFGGPGDVPVPGDYDGVGHDQIAVYRPSTGQFFIAGHAQPISLGVPGDVPIPGKYDSTTSSHLTEPAVFNPSTGLMTILGPNGVSRNVQFAAGTIPVPHDYDGIGRDEPAVLDPATNIWTIAAPGAAQRTVQFGASGGVPVASPLNYRKLPVPGDYAGIGEAQFALFRRTTPNATWFIGGVTGPNGVAFGSGSADEPLQADFIGNGKPQLATYRPSTSTWFVQGLYPNGIGFGAANLDIPVPADYNGTGAASIATWRPSTGQWFIAGIGPAVATFGTQGDTPVPGDYDGTGKAEEAVFEPATAVHPTQWLIDGPNNTLRTVVYGGPNDLPVPGDYDGVGHTQIATFRPGTGQWFVAGHAPVSFGGPNDIPAPADYDGVGHLEFATFRPSTGQLFIAGHAPISFGGPNDIPANAPYVFRALNNTIRSASVTASELAVPSSLDFASQAVAMSVGSSPSTSTGTTTSSATITAASVSTSSSTTPTPAAAPVAIPARHRPPQHVHRPKGNAGGSSAGLVHDSALAALQGRFARLRNRHG